MQSDRQLNGADIFKAHKRTEKPNNWIDRRYHRVRCALCFGFPNKEHLKSMLGSITGLRFSVAGDVLVVDGVVVATKAFAP